ncbi:hypothetical protein CYMTET_28681, partial [Cymbomonas tetramitiformis]
MIEISEKSVSGITIDAIVTDEQLGVSRCGIYFRSPSGKMMDHFVAQEAETPLKYFSFHRTLILDRLSEVGLYTISMFQCNSFHGNAFMYDS